jgi:pyruvate dehydrogenase phosphatase
MAITKVHRIFIQRLSLAESRRWPGSIYGLSSRQFLTNTNHGAKQSSRFLGLALGVAIPATVYMSWPSGAPETIDPNAPLEVRYFQCMQKIRNGEVENAICINQSHIVRTHSTSVASNSPVEDQMFYGTAPGVSNKSWVYWGVFDGHAGFATSRLLNATLVSHVAHDLSGLYGEQATAGIVSTIKKSFLDLDNRIVRSALIQLRSDISLSSSGSPRGLDSPSASEILAPAYAGSCALLAMFDPEQFQLRVACTGDSRAVLGRGTMDGKYAAIPLSIDQTGFNPAEVKRIADEHPGEGNVVDPKSGRVLGMAISRAFGDARYKWEEKDSENAHQNFGGPKILSLGPKGSVKTPPYLTAEPEVTETALNITHDNADFLIMASDGLWDHISSEDAVACISEWAKRIGNASIRPTVVKKMGVSKDQPGDLTFAVGSEEFSEWQVEPSNFVYEEPNAATHLVQNALGGNRRNLFARAVGAEKPLSRYARDDVTVHVVFFGNVHGHEISRWTENSTQN